VDQKSVKAGKLYLALLPAFIRPQLRERCLGLVIVIHDPRDGGIIAAVNWREEVEPPEELEKRDALFPREWLGVDHSATIPPKQSTRVTEKEDAKGKHAKLRMMKSGGIGDQLSTDLVSRMRPPNVTFQVTILILVSHQIRMCVEYIVAFVLILDLQVDGLGVQRLLALTVVRELPINGDVWFLLLF